jgi:hypothetical protein
MDIGKSAEGGVTKVYGNKDRDRPGSVHADDNGTEECKRGFATGR